MTFEEFDATRWGVGMLCKYRGDVCHIVSVDFEERLLGLSHRKIMTVVPMMARCESVELVDQPK